MVNKDLQYYYHPSLPEAALHVTPVYCVSCQTANSKTEQRINIQTFMDGYSGEE